MVDGHIVTVEPLSEVIPRMRARLASCGDPAQAWAEASFTGVPELVDWLRDCAAKLQRQEFVTPSMEDEPDTLYLDINEVVLNTDRWFIGAIAHAWASRDDEIQFDPLFDSVIGHEAGLIKADLFTLTGLEPLQTLVADQVDSYQVIGQFAVVMAMELVDRALAVAGPLGVRVASCRGEEPIIAVWEHDGDRWNSTVHSQWDPWQ